MTKDRQSRVNHEYEASFNWDLDRHLSSRRRRPLGGSRLAWGAAVISLLAMLTLAGCGGTSKSTAASGGEGDSQYETLELRYQGGVGSVTYPELAEALGYLAPIKLKWIGNTISGPQDIQTAATGQSDFGGAFNGAIVKLISAGAPVKAVIGYYGVDKDTYIGFYTLDDSPIKTAKDLIGKKIGVNTLGAHSEFVIKEYLRRNGLTEDEIKQVTLVVIPPVNAEQSLRQKQIDVAALGSILRDKALERGGIRPLFTDYDLFGTFTAGSYVFTDKFIKENPNTVRKFVEATGKAIEWARTTPREQVIAKYKEIIDKRDRKEDTTAIQYWKSTGIAGAGGYIRKDEFQVWTDWLVKDGELKEGQIKLEDLYTNEFSAFKDTEEKK
ncbi:ABC-type nitrate/sulfonate/bicarbonate transport system substrate-binding protein [Paenibacillus cellulosilyticus]|uniref:ABC-type nitrate/sulfonate/bicarbonate transport system substrate-binding protein n=2 Tax=Paenibacillus cellulosilyticus TaxID=375489 RepID=A0A2V2YLE2_9BACL|nr:ABC-type nitrate/sulfonate/bicarbonate transport system substrate-binding protein [Paenibacillus cellulosilyticus]